jgi:hypothetical protein
VGFVSIADAELEYSCGIEIPTVWYVHKQSTYTLFDGNITLSPQALSLPNGAVIVRFFGDDDCPDRVILVNDFRAPE